MCAQFACAVRLAAFWAGAQDLGAGWGPLPRAHAAGAFGEEDLVWNGAHVEAPGGVYRPILEPMGLPARGSFFHDTASLNTLQ